MLGGFHSHGGTPSSPEVHWDVRVDRWDFGGFVVRRGWQNTAQFFEGPNMALPWGEKNDGNYSADRWW